MNKASNAAVLLCFLGTLTGACGSAGNGDDEEGIVIGGIFAFDVSEVSRKDMEGAKLAIEEINAAGVFPVPLRMEVRSPATGDFIDPERAANMVKSLYDEEEAVAFVGAHAFETLYKMIEVTNSDGYADFIQCSATSEDPGANLPGMAGADDNDNFYRTVISYANLLDLGTRIFMENSWHQIGLYRFDNSAGEEVSLGVRLKIGEHSDEGFSLAFDEAIPNDAFDVSYNKPGMDEVIAMSQRGEVDTTVLAVLQAQSNGLTKYLTDNGYHGTLFQTAGSESADMFRIATGISNWMEQPGNVMIGVEPDAYQGANSPSFVDAFVSRWGEEPASGSATAYDCVFAFALSLLYGGGDEPMQTSQLRAALKEKLPNFKEDNRQPDEVSVGIGTAEFQRAAQLIRENKRIDLEGASGRLLFDENGDRPGMGMHTFGPNSDATGWEVKDQYDEDFNKI